MYKIATHDSATGEQGKGFAVVAEEVKKLAEEGCLGNKNIFTILGGVTSEVTATVVQDVITAATSMALTLPIVEYAPDNAGSWHC